MPRTGLQKERRATGDSRVDCRAGLLSRSVYTARLFSRSLISTPGPILLGMTTFGLQPMRPRPWAAAGAGRCTEDRRQRRTGGPGTRPRLTTAHALVWRTLRHARDGEPSRAKTHLLDYMFA